MDLAKAAGADHVVFGSITLLGTKISTDLRMAHPLSGRTLLAFSRSGPDAAALIDHADDFADQVRREVFHTTVRPITKPAPLTPPRRPQPSSGPVSDIHQHPEKLLQQPYESDGQARLEDGDGTLRLSAANAIRGPRLDDQVQGVTTGDVDGDGGTDIVIAGISHLWVYGFRDNRFFKMAQMDGRGNYIGVDTADLNGNGRDEIFVTNFDNDNGRPHSFVLEYDGRNFQRLAEGMNYYFRSIRIPHRGRVLHGQRRGFDSLFVPGIHEMVWQDGSYELADRLKAPKERAIFGLGVGTLPESRNTMTFAYDSKGQIVVTNSTGRQEWVSEDGFGSVAAKVIHKSKEDPRERSHHYIQGRIDVVDVDADGVNEVVAVRNVDITSSVFSKTRLFRHGRLEILKPDQLGLATRWRTRYLTKYISDFSVDDMDGDGQPEIVVALVQKGRSAISSGSSYLYLFKLTQPAAVSR
jgi:hypothetical protein